MTKLFVCLALVALAVGTNAYDASRRRSELVAQGYTEEINMAHYSYHRGLETVVVPFDAAEAPARFSKFFSDAMQLKEAGLLAPNDGSVDPKWCPNKSFYEFIPVFTSEIHLGTTAEWESFCFAKMSGSFVLNPDGNGYTVTVTAAAPKTKGCSEFWVVSSREHFYYKAVLEEGTHTVKVDTFQPYEKEDITSKGLSAYYMPCGDEGTIASVLRTVNTFVARDDQQLFKHNVEFMKEKLHWDMVKHGKQQKIDKKLIRSGSYLAIMRLDGLDPMIMFGTGGHTGHSAVAFWHGEGADRDLYVVESTDANPFGKVYWPPPYGVIIHKYDDWVPLGVKADYHVGLLQVTEEWANRWNETAAWDFFKSVEGLGYGYSTMLYSFMDTFPMRNLPQPIEQHLFDALIPSLDRALKNDTKVSVYRLFIEGINKRFNMQCNDMTCVTRALDAKNLTFAEATTIPENDAWTYFDGSRTGRAMVCSVFAASMWKAGWAGQDDWMGGEQTPKDNYMNAIYDGNFFNTQNCPDGLMTTPKGTYCQLMGDYELTLPGYNSVPFHKDMNNHCPAQYPDFFRCPENNPSCC